MKWIKASEGLPKKRDIYFVKVIHKNDDPRNEDAIVKSSWLIENGQPIAVTGSITETDWYVLVEWLDESDETPTNKGEGSVSAENVFRKNIAPAYDDNDWKVWKNHNEYLLEFIISAMHEYSSISTNNDKQVYSRSDMEHYCDTAFVAGYANGSLPMNMMLEVKKDWLETNLPTPKKSST